LAAIKRSWSAIARSLSKISDKISDREEGRSLCQTSSVNLPPRPAEHLVLGHDGPVAVVSGRIAALLLARAGLDQYHRAHRGEDPELDSTLVALKVTAAAWRATGTNCGTATPPSAPPASPSPAWLTTRAVARSLGMTSRAVRKAITVGRLPAQHWAGRWWINPDDVEHLRARRTA
jgi:hypothetical protein